MTRKLIVLSTLLLLLASCGNQDKQTDESISASETTVAALLADASPLANQTIKVKGTVVHVCRHGGQRLFIVGPDSEDRFRITTGEDIAEFKIDLEGSQIEVTGIVNELIIDETYLAEWESEVTDGADEHARGEGHEGGVGHGEHTEGESAEEEHSEVENSEAEAAATLENIQSLRDEIIESGKDHLSDYWIETISFKVLEAGEGKEESAE
jgi:hypothetical protein